MSGKEHTFPAFYACYLLKSVRTPRATATYIGSTPSPPRRIRQHNGVISQGAWKTKHNRPWVMTMIVHGFPSKLTALQFEWAWQHPHISRHLRDDDGKAVFSSSGRSRYLAAHVRVARSMIASHPYNSWPLRVTFFTAEAATAWATADALLQKQNSLPLPAGFTTSTELEGVDGTARSAPGDRTGPIDVTDATFTGAHLAKMTRVLGSHTRLACSVCDAEIAHDADALGTALCPAATCTSVAHLACLARTFLAAQPPITPAPLIPRGGTCSICGEYVLWGDVVRGCFRRRARGAVVLADAEGDDRAEDADGDGALFGAADGEEGERGARSKKPASAPSRTRAPARSKKPTSAPARAGPSVPRTRMSHGVQEEDEEGERFDLDAISSCSEESERPPAPRRRARPDQTRRMDRRAEKSRGGPAVPLGDPAIDGLQMRNQNVLAAARSPTHLLTPAARHLAPFPELPPLSPPRRPAWDSADVVEISSD